MTYQALVEEIISECKLEGDTDDWETRLFSIINDVVQALEVNLEEPSRYVAGFVLDSTAQEAGTGTSPRDTITLPTDVLKLDFIQFSSTELTGGGGELGYPWELPPQKQGLVPPAPIYGYPKAYNLYGTFASPVGTTDGQPRLMLVPPYVMTAADFIHLYYWRKFDITIDGGNDIQPSHWTPAIKLETMKRVERYHGPTSDSNQQADGKDAEVDMGGLQKVGQMKTNSSEAYAPSRNQGSN